MQTLGLSHSTPRTEGRLKALLWPTIRNGGDFEYITEQGFWVCLAVASMTLVLSLLTGGLFIALFEFLFYFLAGVGVRQRSKIAAGSAFVAYLLDAIVMQRYTGNGFGILRIVFLALLLSNIRGIWLSSRWERDAALEPTPIRLSEMLFDKLSDQLPRLLWPKTKWIFIVVTVAQIALLLALLVSPVPLQSR